MKEGQVLRGLRRIFTPAVVVAGYYFLKFRAKVSPRAEVDLTGNISFGPGCVVGSFTKIKANEGPLTIGKRGGFANGCFVSAGAGGITIGDNFICGPNVNIVAHNYQYGEKGQHLEDLGITSKGIRIGHNVWVGAGSTITDGAVIGDNTIVTANSLVCRRYQEDAILQGIPAKQILRRQ